MTYRHTDDLSKCDSLGHDGGIPPHPLRCITHERQIVNEGAFLTDVERWTYEVWQVSVRVSTGQVTDKRLLWDGKSEDNARTMAEQYEAEADENFRAESLGPVKPRFRKIFLVARATTTREAV